MFVFTLWRPCNNLCMFTRRHMSGVGAPSPRQTHDWLSDATLWTLLGWTIVNLTISETTGWKHGRLHYLGTSKLCCITIDQTSQHNINNLNQSILSCTIRVIYIQLNNNYDPLWYLSLKTFYIMGTFKYFKDILI